LRDRAAARWFGLDRPWPPVLRVVAGAGSGWAAVRWGVTEPTPGWARAGAIGVSAIGGLTAPAVARGAGASVVAWWAAASTYGLYLSVPETDHIVGVGAVVVVLVLGSLTSPRQASWLLVAGLDVVLAWAAVRGAPASGPALVAGLSTPGLLIVAPASANVPGPAHALVPAVLRSAALIGLQVGYAVFLARVAARSDTVAVAAAIVGAALVVLVVAARFAVGSQSS
jgi:hypothetical protein